MVFADVNQTCSRLGLGFLVARESECAAIVQEGVLILQMAEEKTMKRR